MKVSTFKIVLFERWNERFLAQKWPIPRAYNHKSKLDTSFDTDCRFPMFPNDPNLKVNDKTVTWTDHAAVLLQVFLLTSGLWADILLTCICLIYLTLSNPTVCRTDSQKPPFTIITNLVYQLYDSFIILVFSHKIYCNRLSRITKI